MPSYSTSDIHNLAFLGHGGSGKTTLTEAILNKAGVIHHLGEVEKGNTVTDFTEEEKEHGNSLFSTAVCYDHKGKHVNLIDTPGFPDFMSQAIMILPAVETAVIVINASNGIEMVTRRMRDRARWGGRRSDGGSRASPRGLEGRSDHAAGSDARPCGAVAPRNPSCPVAQTGGRQTMICGSSTPSSRSKIARIGTGETDGSTPARYWMPYARIARRSFRWCRRSRWR